MSTERHFVLLVTQVQATPHHQAEHEDKHGGGYDTAHKYAFMLKTGATKSEHMIFFFELLHSKLCDWFGEEYISSTVVVLDNASVHVSDRCKAYLKWKRLSVLTLPPYTPEQNHVEQAFKRLKTDLSKWDFSKKRLEYIVCEAIMKMK